LCADPFDDEKMINRYATKGEGKVKLRGGFVSFQPRTFINLFTVLWVESPPYRQTGQGAAQQIDLYGIQARPYD
jgi:hypothetical protein